jgi:hypothetical protein
MTPEQKSRQASRNANAKRIVWQREAMRAKTQVAKQAAALENIGKEITRLSDVLRKRSDELDLANRMLRVADARAGLWRQQYVLALDNVVQQQATEQAAKDEPMPY